MNVIDGCVGKSAQFGENAQPEQRTSAPDSYFADPAKPHEGGEELERVLSDILTTASRGEPTERFFSPKFETDDKAEIERYGFGSPTDAIKAIKASCPDAKFQLIQSACAASASNPLTGTAFMRNHISGTHSDKDFCGIAPTGKRFSVEYIQMLEFEDGLITKRTTGYSIDKVYAAIARNAPKASVSATPVQVKSAPAPRDQMAATAYNDSAIVRRPKPFCENSLAEKVVGDLLRLGIDTVFGVSGGNICGFMTQAEVDGMRVVTTMREDGAAFMAKNFSLSGRTENDRLPAPPAPAGTRPCVVCATSGPGAANAINGLMCAKSASAPIIALLGLPPAAKCGVGAVQQMGKDAAEQVALFKNACKSSMLVQDPLMLRQTISRAYVEACSGRPGPIAVHVPHSFWALPDESKFSPRVPAFVPVAPEASSPVLSEAGRILAEASRPMMIVGSGVRVAGAAAQAIRLAELLGSAVATTAAAKNVFPEDHRLSAGIFIFGGTRSAHQALRSADVVLVAGSSLTESSLSLEPGLLSGKRVIRIDADPDAAARNHEAAIFFNCDARTALQALESAVALHVKNTGSNGTASLWHTESPPRPSGHTEVEENLRSSDAIPIEQPRLKAEIERVLRPGDIYCADVGSTFMGSGLLRGKEGIAFLCETSWSSMGQETAGAVGSAFASPGRTVFVECGDGCFMMNGMEVATASRYGLPVIFIVNDNSMHGLVKFGTDIICGSDTGVGRLVQTDYAAMGKAMGASSWTVERPEEIAPSLEAARATGGTCLIHVKISVRIPEALKRRVGQLEVKTPTS